MHNHRRRRTAHILRRIAAPQLRGFIQRESLRDVAVEGIVGAGLIGRDVNLHAAAHNLGQHIAAVTHQAHRKRAAFAAGLFAKVQSFVEVRGEQVAISRRDPALDAAAIDFDNQRHAAVEGDGKRLRTTHAAHPASDDKFSFERAGIARLGEMPIRECCERLEGALQDALRADVDPTTRRHLAIHHQAFAIELVEVLPGGPFAHQVGVGDENTRRHFVRRKHRNRLA